MVVHESISQISIAYHLQCTEQLHIWVDCFFPSPTDSLHPKTASMGQMVENCVNHVTLDPEGMFKLLIQEARGSTDPVTENAGLRPWVVIFYAWMVRWIIQESGRTFCRCRFPVSRGRSCSSIVCTTILQRFEIFLVRIGRLPENGRWIYQILSYILMPKYYPLGRKIILLHIY